MPGLVWILLAALVVAALAWWLWRRRAALAARGPRVTEARDTVADWPPTATRLLTTAERQAFETVRQAVPELTVLAQVPLARFIRVPTRHSYGEWLGRVGQLCVDLLVCDRDTGVLAVIEVRPVQESERGRQRHQRMTRVLKAAGLRVIVWAEHELPLPQAVRELLLPQQAAAERTATPPAARAAIPAAGPLTAIPVAEVHQPGEPPPTTWYSDLDAPSPRG
jgi:hypothetical protein